jgi:hypothetical protein
MSIRNRELSQFGSFIYIDDATKTVGIATTATPYVGIGTTNATAKLTVIGDTNISGVVSATSFYGDGSTLDNVLAIVIDGWVSNAVGLHTLSNVGIGTTNPTSKLTVGGDITATGTITGSNISLTGFEVSSGVVTASRFNATVATGTAPLTVASQTLVTNLNADYLRGKVSPSGDIVGTTDSQTLTNKTLTLPTFGSTGVAFTGSTSGVSTVRAASTASGIVVIPAVTGIQTFVTTNAVGIVTSGMIADLSIVNADVATNAAIVYSKLNLSNSIVNADIASGAAIAVSKLAASTISGISLGSNLNNLTAGSYINYSSGSTYNGSSAITVSVAATTANTADTIVARDASGDFSVGSISCANVTATFTVEAADFNSTSDENLKSNIETVQNPLDTLHQLRGVTFDWKTTNKPSVGVIAQEIEQVLPQLVNEGEHKSVNYNGLIGVLIEAVKELSAEVEDLKSQLNK